MDAMRQSHGIRRRQAIKRLIAGGAASAALPSLGRAASPTPMPLTSLPSPVSLGSALPPDPRLSATNWKPVFFDSHQNETLIVLSDLIIPDTDTPGAKAAQVNRFIDFLLAAQSATDQKEYLEALSWLDGYCLSRHSKPFTGLRQEDQSAVLTLLTRTNKDPELRRGIALFHVVKDSIVQAYYTSETGMLEELKYQTNAYQLSFPACKNQPEYSEA